MSNIGSTTALLPRALGETNSDRQALVWESATPSLLFPPFRLDITNKQLYRGSQQLLLRPKTFAVLHYLVERAHRLVTKVELLQAVWPDTSGNEGLPKGCISICLLMMGKEGARM